MRLDVYLSDHSLVDSRTDAKNFILSGAVTVDGRTVKKPSFEVSGDEDILVDKSGKRFVSRGGLKLEKAMESWDISLDGKVCMDIGASTGGFTDCMLKNGAVKV